MASPHDQLPFINVEKDKPPFINVYKQKLPFINVNKDSTFQLYSTRFPVT